MSLHARRAVPRVRVGTESLTRGPRDRAAGSKRVGLVENAGKALAHCFVHACRQWVGSCDSVPTPAPFFFGARASPERRHGAGLQIIARRAQPKGRPWNDTKGRDLVSLMSLQARRAVPRARVGTESLTRGPWDRASGSKETGLARTRACLRASFRSRVSSMGSF
jgi:hypothetical protein